MLIWDSEVTEMPLKILVVFTMFHSSTICSGLATLTVRIHLIHEVTAVIIQVPLPMVTQI